MQGFVQGADRQQTTLFAECLDDWVDEGNSIRAVDVFVDALELRDLGFDGVDPAATGRPAYHPSPTREQISMDIQRLWMETRKTALHITHSIPEAVLLADRVIVMGPRPGRIVEIIDIDLPRPRRLDQLPARFHEYSTRIRDIFKSKGVLAMD